MNKRSEERLYRRIGLLVLISLILTIVIALIYSPEESDIPEDICQQYKVRGVDVKENNASFRKFLAGIKLNNGVLVLGSSETGAFGEENYHGLMNTYFDCGHDFSVMGGAGRTAHVYYPMFLNNKEMFKGMKVLYFVNPTYWRESLNYFQLGYYERYNSTLNLSRCSDELDDYGLLEEYGGQLITSGGLINKFTYTMESVRKPFIELMASLKDGKVVEELDCIDMYEREPIDSAIIQETLEEIILAKNISVEFDQKDSENFVKIKDSDYQFNALKGFNTICQDLGIDITYILGPYNGVYCQKFSPEYCQDHDEVIVEIRNFFQDSNCSFIDCSDLSYVPGTFIDVQHHSKYAAWIIADRISKHYEKNN